MNDGMRNKILGMIGVVWGWVIVVYVAAKGVSRSGSYATGTFIGLAFGIALLIAGVRTLTKHRRA